MSATTAIPAVSLAPGVAALAEKPEADRPHTPNQEDLAFGCPRFFLPEAKQVYVVVSSRARGVSVGVNLNPDQSCNFDCCYCEVGRRLTQAAGLAPVLAQGDPRAEGSGTRLPGPAAETGGHRTRPL